MEGYLSQRDAEQAYTLVEECCELGREPNAWQEHLASGLERVIGGYAGAFLATEPTKSERRVFGANISQDLCVDGRSLFSEFVHAGGRPEAPGLQGAWSGQPGTVFCASLVELSSVAAFHDSTFYHSYLKPLHVHDLLTALAAPSGGVRINLAICRARHERPFTVRDRSIMNALVAAAAARFEKRLHSQRQGAPLSAGEAVLMVTDMVDFTGLLRRAGDLRARAIIRRHNETMRATFAQHHAREVAHTGDGFIVAFGCENEAVSCASEIQRKFADRCASVHGEAVRIRIGMHAGPVLEEETRLFGAALVTAVRICGHARAGQILISERVLGRLEHEMRSQARSVGVRELKGFGETAVLYEISFG